MRHPCCWRPALSVILIVLLTAGQAAAQLPAPLPPRVLRPLPPRTLQVGVHVNVPGPLGIRVNTFHGSLEYSRTDLTIPGRGLDLEINLDYRSGRSGTDVGLGFGWQLNYNIAYFEDPVGDIFIDHGTRGLLKYVRYEGAFNWLKGTRDRLEEYEPGRFRLRSQDGVQTYFDSPEHKHVTSIEDPNGNRQTFSYEGEKLTLITDTSGREIELAYSGERLVSITDSNAMPERTIELQYDGASDLVAITDLVGNTTSFSYADHRLTSVTDPRGNTVEIAFADDVVTNFTSSTVNKSLAYDAESLTTTLTELVEGVSRVTRYVYDEDGRIRRIENPAGRSVKMHWNTNSFLNHFINEKGKVTRYTYDLDGNALTVKNPLGNVTTYTYELEYNKVTSITDANGYLTAYDYDASGNLTRVVDPLGKETIFGYDDYGQVVSSTNSLGETTTFSYNEHGDRTGVLDPLGNATSFTYDAVGNVLHEIDANGHVKVFTYDAANRLLTRMDPLDHVTRYIYDVAGNLISRTDANDHTTTFSYDLAGRLASRTDPLGATTTFTYDAADNELSRTDANGHTTTSVYNVLNRLVSRTDPLGHSTSFIYDAAGSLRSRTDANGNSTSFRHDAADQLIRVKNPLGHMRTITYDGVGNRLSENDANDHTTRFAYDGLNRLVRVTDPLRYETTYEYDDRGNLSRIIDANGHATTFVYDAANRRIEERDPLNHVTRFTYDGVGNLIGKTDANGMTSIRSYDAADRLIAIDYPVSGRFEYSYDAVGNEIGMSNPHVGVTQSYDAADRLTEHLVTTTGFSKSVSYTYDQVGNRATMTDPDGGVTLYAYDDADRLISLTNAAGDMTRYAFDGGNRLVRKDYQNGTYALYTYDAANQVLLLSNEDPGETVISSFAYTYDPAGNRISVTEADGRQTAYTYDDLDQLTDVASFHGTSARYTYDGVGNRVALLENGIFETLYAYDEADRLLVAGDTIYGWDDNGNQTIKSVEGEATTYTYDEEDRLTAVTFPDGSTNSLSYYPDGRHLSTSRRTGKELVFIYDKFNILLDAKTTGVSVNRYTSGLAVDDWISLELPETTYYYHKDALGSVTELTGTTGAAVTIFRYAAFGGSEPMSESIKKEISFRYTGRRLDDSADLYFYRFRAYDPIVGRFLARDPLEDFLKLQGGIHPYVYVSNNPINTTDPFGLFGFKDALKLAEAGLMIASNSLSKSQVPGFQTAGEVLSRAQDVVSEIAKAPDPGAVVTGYVETTKTIARGLIDKGKAIAGKVKPVLATAVHKGLQKGISGGKYAYGVGRAAAGALAEVSALALGSFLLVMASNSLGPEPQMDFSSCNRCLIVNGVRHPAGSFCPLNDCGSDTGGEYRDGDECSKQPETCFEEDDYFDLSVSSYPPRALLVSSGISTGAVVASIPVGGGELVSKSGRVRVSIPKASLSRTIKLLYFPQEIRGIESGFAVLHSFVLATNEGYSERSVASLKQPFSLQVNYTEGELANVKEKYLKLYYLETTRDRWLPLAGRVDESKNAVLAQIEDFGMVSNLYALMAPQFSSLSLISKMAKVVGWAGSLLLLSWFSLGRQRRRWPRL